MTNAQRQGSVRSDAELIATLIYNGIGTSTACDLATKLLLRFGGLRQLLPAVEAVALEHDVHFVFNRLTYPILWADPAYDLTERIIERLDAN